MRTVFSHKFLRQYYTSPEIRQRQFDKQLAFLLTNLRHPSLRTKIYDESYRIWQARVNGGWRFYFQIRGDAYYFLTIGPHPK
jgi:hypothetical protein